MKMFVKNKLAPAVFLDRDGVICKEAGYITSPQQIEIYPCAIEGIRQLKNAGYKVIVITNQSAVARGMLSEEQLKIIHDKLYEILQIDDVYYCPHYPPQGEVISSYHIECSCRKPKPGMILSAAAKHRIDLACSYMVGDRAIDILAGQNAGVKTVHVHTGYGEKGLELDVQPDYVFENLKGFVDFILSE